MSSEEQAGDDAPRGCAEKEAESKTREDQQPPGEQDGDQPGGESELAPPILTRIDTPLVPTRLRGLLSSSSTRTSRTGAAPPPSTINHRAYHTFQLPVNMKPKPGVAPSPGVSRMGVFTISAKNWRHAKNKLQTSLEKYAAFKGDPAEYDSEHDLRQSKTQIRELSALPVLFSAAQSDTLKSYVFVGEESGTEYSSLQELIEGEPIRRTADICFVADLSEISPKTSDVRDE